MIRGVLVPGAFIAAACTVQPSLGYAQDQVAELSLNARIEREPAADQTHTFSIALQSSQ
jgi:hypothetical protein